MNDNEKECYDEKFERVSEVASHSDLREEKAQLLVDPQHRETQKADNTNIKYQSCCNQCLTCFRRETECFKAIISKRNTNISDNKSENEDDLEDVGSLDGLQNFDRVFLMGSQLHLHSLEPNQ